MRIGRLMQIGLTLGIALFFVASVSYADTQAAKKECKDSAYNLYKSKGYAKMGCGTSSHYNAKLDACFVRLVCDSDHGKKASEYIEDVSKGKNLARYVNTRPSTDSGTCIVGGKQCKNYHEFHDLIKPYMEE
jgi:hypothetical protein